MFTDKGDVVMKTVHDLDLVVVYTETCEDVL